MELINPLHRGICFDLIRFHSIAENIVNEYILMFLLSYSVLFSPNQTRWTCHPPWNMLRSSVPSHWWPSCIIAMNQFSWANPIIQCLCASHFCAHFQSVESIWAKKEQVAHRYIKFSIWIMNSGHPHCHVGPDIRKAAQGARHPQGSRAGCSARRGKDRDHLGHGWQGRAQWLGEN